MKFAAWAVIYGLLHSVELRLGVTFYWHVSEAPLVNPVWSMILSIDLPRAMGGEYENIKVTSNVSEYQCLRS